MEIYQCVKGDGSLPVPGWTDEYEWEGYIPFDQLPKVINPKQGFISTANNKIVDDDYPYHISNTWAQPYRQMRIQEFFAREGKVYGERFRRVTDGSKEFIWERVYSYIFKRVK